MKCDPIATTDHAKLSNLAYASAGHTGFAGLAVANTFTGGAQIVDGEDFEHQPDVGDLFKAGLGQQGEIALGANLDQDDVLFFRHVDGGGSHAEAGSVVVIQRDVTNVTAENGNFLECQNAAGGVLARFEKGGHLVLQELVRLKQTITELGLRNAADTTYYGLRGQDLVSHGVVRTAAVADRDLNGSALQVGGKIRTGSDTVPGDLSLMGNSARASAVVNQDGGDVLLYAGDHATGGGNEGSVKHTNADGATVVFETTEDSIGFFGIGPVTQRLKANYNNWAAFTDVVDALVALGLFDAA